MRCKVMAKPKHKRIRFIFPLAIMVFALLVAWFNAYINSEIRPTLMELAEYEARSSTLKCMHTAIDDALNSWDTENLELYRVTDKGLQLDAASANRLRNTLTASVQEAMEQAPTRVYSIPFGSLTGNSLLSGHGPGWKVEWRPQGYVQAEWRERCESVSINTTRYSADLVICVTVNMILDGRTETLQVEDTLPLASILLSGETPIVYGTLSD